MKEVIIDTDILSYYFKGDKKVVKSFQSYLLHFNLINISIITYYEIISGLNYKDASKQLKDFNNFADENNIIPLTKRSVEESAKIYSDLRKRGNIISDIDILIAGIAVENKLVLVSNNEKDLKN